MIQNWQQFNENKIGDLFRKLFKISTKEKASVKTEETKEETPKEKEPYQVAFDDLTKAVINMANSNIEVNNNLQKMADDISIDFSRNRSSNKIYIYSEYPNQVFSYTFSDGRKVKMSYIPGGDRGSIIWQQKYNLVTTFDINSTTVNNWINEFSKLRSFSV